MNHTAYHKLTALLLALLMSVSLLGQNIALAAEEAVQSVTAGQTLNVGDPEFWEDFHEEYAEDAEYLKQYQAHQEDADEEASISVQSDEKTALPSPFTKEKYDHGAYKTGYTVDVGIDVSKWQGEIDWKKVKAAGVKYVIIRCGYTSLSSFTLTQDQKFKDYIEGASAVGLPIGIYYFSQAKTEQEAEQEAKKTIAILKPYKSKITLPVFYDPENMGKRLTEKNCTPAQGVKNAKKFFSTLQAAGYQVGLYGNAWDLTTICDYTKLTDYPLWLARYSTKTGFSGTYEYWQYTSKGQVNGIESSETDCNFRYTKKAAETATPPTISSPAPDTTPDTTPDPSEEATEETEAVEQPEITVPAQVTGLKQLSCTTSSITIGWDAAEGAEQYIIYTSNQKSGTYTKIGTTTETSYTYKKLNTNYGYYFKVKAANSAGKGTASSAFGTTTAKGSQRTLYTTANSLNLRKGAGTEYDSLTGLPKYTVLNISYEIKGTDGASWYKVTYTDSKGNTYKGFLSGKYVKVGYRAKPTKKTKLRSSVTSSAVTRKMIPAGNKVVLLSTKKDSKGKLWYYSFYKKSGKAYVGYLLGSDIVKY